MVNRNAPKELRTEYGLLGGVIEFGNSIYFVKAVGKNDLIKANKSNFNEFRSGRQDSNLRLSAPKADTLPD